CDRADGLSLFDLTSGASPAPPATADSTVRSHWATRDAAARLADAVVARYSSPATAALSRLFLPYLFPDLTAFPTDTDLITHLRTSDTRYRAALPAEFCAKNPPPMGVPPHPSYPLLPLLLRPTSVVSSRSALRLPLAADAASARARGAGVPVGLAGAVEVVVVEAVEGAGVVVGVVAGVEASVAAVEAAEVEVAEAVAEVAEAAVALVAALRRGVVLVVVRARSISAVARPLPPSSFVSGTLVVSGVGVLVPAPTFCVQATAL
ncbi:unnamed protein product, partial [Closterium sp. NIES-54]